MAKIFVCGDIVNYEHEDGLICANEIVSVIKDADYAICNFEAPIEVDEKPEPKSGGHHFQRKGTLRGLRQQGFDLLCLANNHIMDYGKLGLEETINEAKNLGLEVVGAGLDFEKAYKPVIKKIDDITVGFINACEAQFGVINYASTRLQSGYAWINHVEVDKQIMDLNKKCDFVVVLAHAGLEHYSIPQKEWRYRYKQFCDLGADVIIGAHPHVPQGYEKYNDSVIFYSLGNFYFDSSNFKTKEDQTYSVVLDLKEGNPIDFKLIYHHKKNDKVHLSDEDNQIDINRLNESLDAEYENLHNQMSLDIYNKVIRGNLIYSIGSTMYDGNVSTTLKRIVNRVLNNRKKVDKSLLSLHLVRNETYHYATVNALELLSKK